jgi:hypothetical protein
MPVVHSERAGLVLGPQDQPYFALSAYPAWSSSAPSGVSTCSTALP